MFDALKNRIRESLAHALGGWIRTAGNVSASMHVAGLDRPAENLLWIYLGMMARMDSIASVPLRISDSADRLIDSGPLADLLSRPNQVMDWVQYVGAIESYLALYNECDVAIVRDERGNPLELFPLNPRHCTPITGVHVGTGVRIGVGWEYCDPTVGQRVAFAPEDIIPMVRISPYDFTRGIWTERPGRRAMQIDILAQEQNLAVFKNGGMPDVIFETDQRWTPEQSDEFLGRWQDRYGGSANAHKPGILYGGLKAKPIGLSPEDLQFFEGRRMSRSEQIALMRVKPAMVGLMEGETGLSQGSSTVEQYASWWRSIGLGELALISSAHQRFLVERHAFSGTRPTRELSVRERAACADHRQRQIRHGIRAPKQTALYVWFDEHEIEELMVTRLQKIDLFEKLCARGYPPDSAGEYLGLRLPPHPANRGLVAFALQPVEDVAGAAVPEREAPMAHGREDRLDGLFARLDGALAEASIPAAVREDEAPSVPPRWRGLRVAADRFIAEREKASARKYSRYYAEQRSRVLDRYQELVATGAKRRETVAPQVDEAGLSPEGTLQAIFPAADENAALSARIRPMIASHLADGHAFFRANDLPAGAPVPDFSVEDPRAMAAIERRVIQASKINETTEEDLRGVLRTAFAEGDTTVQLGERIAEYYRAHVGETSARPMTAARTQTAGIVNDGRMLAAREVGGLLKGWLHGGSRDPREAHVAAQSKYQTAPIALDAKFVVNGHSTDAPGSTELPIGEVANCTCMVTFHRMTES